MNQDFSAVSNQYCFEKMLKFFLKNLPLLRERKFCEFVAQKFIKDIESWCREDTGRWNLLGETQASLNSHLEAAELRDRNQRR